MSGSRGSRRVLRGGRGRPRFTRDDRCEDRVEQGAQERDGWEGEGQVNEGGFALLETLDTSVSVLHSAGYLVHPGLMRAIALYSECSGLRRNVRQRSVVPASVPLATGEEQGPLSCAEVAVGGRARRRRDGDQLRSSLMVPTRASDMPSHVSRGYSWE